MVEPAPLLESVTVPLASRAGVVREASVRLRVRTMANVSRRTRVNASQDGTGHIASLANVSSLVSMEVSVVVSTSVDVFRDSPEIIVRWFMSPRRRDSVMKEIRVANNSAEVSSGAGNKTVATSTKMTGCR